MGEGLDKVLTAQQLYADLVAACKKPPVPEGSFTVEQFSNDTGLAKKQAYEEIMRRHHAGELGRISDGKRHYYYFIGVSTNDTNKNGD